MNRVLRRYAVLGCSLLLAVGSLPIAAAAGADAANSCTASDNSSRTCVFSCLEGATVTVKGSNANEWYDQTFTASCGTAHASCEADPGETCVGSDVTTSAGEGQCNMESDGEGSATCSSAGGQTAPSCLEDPVDCLCPDWICGYGEPPAPGIPWTIDIGALGKLPGCKAMTIVDPGLPSTHQNVPCLIP